MKKRVGIVSLILALLVANVLPLPLLGVAETGDEALTYTFPSEAYGTIDTRYVRVEVDKLDACLYAYLDKDGNVGYRILADVLDADGHTVGSKLLDVSIQDAVIYDEDQPDILITVHPGNGTPEFLSKLSKQQKKQVKKGKLTVETELGDVTFVVDEYLHPKANEATAEPTQASTNKPETTSKPQNTNKPDNTPKPTATPKPAGTPEPTPEPYHWKCKECGQDFGEDYDAWYHHAWINPGHYNEPTENPGGHYEQHWVVDSPAVTHDEWVCSCGHHSMSDADNTAHCKGHLSNNEDFWYKVITVTDVPEQGHWETVWVPDP